MSSLVAFGSKAETLERLLPLLKTCSVLQLFYFTVQDWKQHPQQVLDGIRTQFGAGRLAVRSSGMAEDAVTASMAGAFRTCLDVEGSDPAAVRTAIEAVMASFHGRTDDQILIQPMVTEVETSGVIMSRDLNTGAPYYVINYDDESGRTDKITGGRGVNKTVFVHRDFHFSFIESERVAALLAMTQELEAIWPGVPIDIEFARTRNQQLHLLQVRPMTVQHSWSSEIDARVSSAIAQAEDFFQERARPRPGVAGSRTILGQMPDWNPAEMIGTHPRPLALSLYRRLITDHVWQAARASMGYRALPRESLMVTMAGQPYIDVRNSFNSFLPCELDESTAGVLVDAWLHRLGDNPHLHDKVEFEVAQTVLDFSFDAVFSERYGGTLSRKQFEDYRVRMRDLTLANLDLSETGSLARALCHMRKLEGLQNARGSVCIEPTGTPRRDLWWVELLLSECTEHGTLPFAVLARHAFMAEALLRSAVARGALTPARYDHFKHALTTVLGEFTEAFGQVLNGRLSQALFLKRFGHLRPGTYEIRSLRYDQRPDLFSGASISNEFSKPAPFELTAQERDNLAQLLTEAGLGAVSPQAFIRYASTSIAAREECKFVFTRHVSDALELISQWGTQVDLDREDLSFLSIERILAYREECGPDTTRLGLEASVAHQRLLSQVTGGLRLFYLIRDIRDLHVAPLHRSAPTFVTDSCVEAPVGMVDSSLMQQDLSNCIVCIENADPGYDWIFTRGIRGLVTRFGGANSHMAIRCAELRLPAAIGVGEQTFDRLLACGRLELNCSERIVRPVYG